MTNKEVDLLITDLCARLPYGVKINIYDDYSGMMKDEELNVFHLNSTYNIEYRKLRPYLRPLSSMTDEEREEWADLFMKPICELEQYADEKEAQDMAPILYGKSHSVSIDWLNKNMFDYRELIPMGLALEALEGMYKTE